MKIIDLLRAFLRPAVEGDDTDPQLDLLEGDDPPVEDPPSDDPPADDPPAEPSARFAAELAAERAATARERERAERFEREAADMRRAAAPRVNDIEEAENKKLADPSTTELERWQIQSNREIRASRNAAQRAEFNAMETSDRASFSLACQANPRLARVKDEVEKRLTQMRANGANANREAIAYYVLGEMVAKSPGKRPAQKSGDTNGIPRGRLPGARSDVNGKNAMSDRDKRAKRLEGQLI